MIAATMMNAASSARCVARFVGGGGGAGRPSTLLLSRCCGPQQQEPAVLLLGGGRIRHENLPLRRRGYVASATGGPRRRTAASKIARTAASAKIAPVRSAGAEEHGRRCLEDISRLPATSWARNQHQRCFGGNRLTNSDASSFYYLERHRGHPNSCSGRSFFSTKSTATTGPTSTAATKAKSASSSAVAAAAADERKQKKVEREMQIRIFKTLWRHVWPRTTTAAAAPAGAPEGKPGTKSPTAAEATASEDRDEIRLRKRRVVASLGLMAAGKAVTIQVPYLFKMLVDSFPPAAALASAASASDPATAADTAAAALAVSSTVPVALLAGYGASRAAASGLQEWRNYVFAHVAQGAIRQVGRSVFDHVHSLDLQYHLSRNTGQLSRVLDRGQRSISFVLNAYVKSVHCL